MENNHFEYSFWEHFQSFGEAWLLGFCGHGPTGSGRRGLQPLSLLAVSRVSGEVVACERPPLEPLRLALLSLVEKAQHPPPATPQPQASTDGTGCSVQSSSLQDLLASEHSLENSRDETSLNDVSLSSANPPPRAKSPPIILSGNNAPHQPLSPSTPNFIQLAAEIQRLLSRAPPTPASPAATGVWTVTPLAQPPSSITTTISSGWGVPTNVSPPTGPGGFSVPSPIRGLAATRGFDQPTSTPAVEMQAAALTDPFSPESRTLEAWNWQPDTAAAAWQPESAAAAFCGAVGADAAEQPVALPPPPQGPWPDPGAVPAGESSLGYDGASDDDLSPSRLLPGPDPQQQQLRQHEQPAQQQATPIPPLALAPVLSVSAGLFPSAGPTDPTQPPSAALYQAAPLQAAPPAGPPPPTFGLRSPTPTAPAVVTPTGRGRHREHMPLSSTLAQEVLAASAPAYAPRQYAPPQPAPAPRRPRGGVVPAHAAPLATARGRSRSPMGLQSPRGGGAPSPRAQSPRGSLTSAGGRPEEEERPVTPRRMRLWQGSRPIFAIADTPGVGRYDPGAAKDAVLPRGPSACMSRSALTHACPRTASDYRVAPSGREFFQRPTNPGPGRYNQSIEAVLPRSPRAAFSPTRSPLRESVAPLVRSASRERLTPGGRDIWRHSVSPGPQPPSHAPRTTPLALLSPSSRPPLALPFATVADPSSYEFMARSPRAGRTIFGDRRPPVVSAAEGKVVPVSLIPASRAHSTPRRFPYLM
ncbi:hypothetical protein PAPYR_2000 [Paratrimastix pyriformis]|uniref:Uncharacterized protein n=1 Tax=Paratrimastix pyriformis TaxID=342808 RepID=A0ABQ8UTN0_9EUKA|nr:hypothetical protein PAPYR_2000 [Paratrimastix pyriformis]